MTNDDPVSTGIRFSVPSLGPCSWQPLLADPKKQWVRGKSARTLAHCWESAHGWPPEVRRAMRDCEDLALLRPIYGFPEFKVPIRGGGRGSQTDLMVIAQGPRGLATVAVEGKVNEPFDKCVHEWLGDSPSKGKVTRLTFLCDLLGLESAAVADTRYQLLHRTASALIEATRIGATAAVMLVHSWGSNLESFRDYEAFAALLHTPAEVGRISRALVDTPPLFLGWVDGDPEWLTS